MYRREPMPVPLRAFVLGLFAVVAFLVAMPVCFGWPLFRSQTASLLEAHAPTEDDRQLAKEIQDAAEYAGDDLHITAEQIAHARRLGKLDELDAVANEMLDGRLEANRPRTLPPRRRMPGEFYREEVEESSPFGGRWSDVGLAGVGFSLFVGAVGAAYGALTMVRNEPPPT